MEKSREEKKARFRAECLTRLKKKGGRCAYRRDKKVTEQLYRYIASENGSTVMLYIPLPNEVNINPLIRRLRREGKHLYVPFMEGKSFRLVKYRYPLRVKRFGIKEPLDSKQYRKKQIDIAVVPVVGVDAAYRRVGFGKGMYDRFFEKEIKNIKRVVFAARWLCYSKEVVTDAYDVRADTVIVP
jgi:5-formyltetrahydrofolate cyclo-ligase